MKEGYKKYEDIIYLPHHRSKRHSQMSYHDRAAQFLPFAALSGHEIAIEETARLTEQKVVLSEEEKARLNDKLLLLAARLQQEPRASITYFLPDKRKSGGAYVTETGKVKKIDEYTNSVIMQNKVIIPITDICSITGTVFGENDQ